MLSSYLLGTSSVFAAESDDVCPPYVRTVELGAHPDLTYACEDYNFFRPVLFESITDSDRFDDNEYGLIQPYEDAEERFNTWLKWYSPLEGISVTIDDIECTVGLLMPRHDGRHDYENHKQKRSVNSFGLMFDKKKPLKQWFDEPFHVTTRSPYLKHVVVEVECMLKDDLALPSVDDELVQLKLMDLAEEQSNFILHGYNRIEEDLKSLLERKTLYVEHFNIFTLPVRVQNKVNRFNIVVMENESFTQTELRRLPRLESQLISDGFSIFNKHAVLGENTTPNIEAIQNGMRDSEYRGNTRVSNYGDTSIHGGLRDAAAANGYLTGRFIDNFCSATYYWNHASRTVADIDGSFLAHCRGRAPHKLFDRIPEDEYCYGNTSDGQWTMREVIKVVKTSIQPVYLFISNDMVAHESHNKSLQEAAFLDLLRGDARNEILDNTLMIFLGDHGQRLHWRDSKKDLAAYQDSDLFDSESLHPALAIRLPNKLTNKYPFLKTVLESNTNKLTCQLDIYETIMDFINGRFPMIDSEIEAITRPSLIRYPSLKLPPSVIHYRNTLNGKSRHNTTYYVESETNCDLLDNRVETDTEFKILSREKLTRFKQMHPYLQYRISDEVENDFESQELLCEAPSTDDLPPRITRVPDIIKNQTIDNYYPGKRWSDGYHAWGDHGISLMYRISPQRICDDFGTEPFLCPCNWSKTLFDESAHFDIDGVSGQTIGDYVKDIKNIKGRAKEFDDPAILAELKPDSPYFKDSMKINDTILKELISERCLEVIKEIPKKFYENNNKERIEEDKDLSEKLCDDTTDIYIITELKMTQVRWWQMHFLGPYGVEVRLPFQLFGECRKSFMNDADEESFTIDNVELGTPIRMDAYELTSRICSSEITNRWKEICTCRQ